MATILYDTFDEATTTAIASHTPNIGGTYSIAASSQSIVGGSGQLSLDTTNQYEVYNTAVFDAAAQTAAFDVTTGAGGNAIISMWLRKTSGVYTGYNAVFRDSGVFIYRFNAGVATTLYSNAGVTPSTNTNYTGLFSISASGVLALVIDTAGSFSPAAADNTIAGPGVFEFGGRDTNWRTLTVTTASADTTPPDITSTGTGATNGPFAANAAEESAAACITLTANETTTWGALAGADAARFVKLNVTTTTVQLGLNPALNFEALPHANPFVVTLTATDAAANVRTVTINVTVTNVTELPGAPTIGTATAGNASATVAFTAPAAGTAPTVTGFTVTSSPGGFTGTGASSPISVNGLANNTAYTFTATAANSDGTGPASAASNSVTPFGSGGATLTLTDFRLWTGSQIFSVTVPFVKVFRISTGALSLELVAQPVNAIGAMSFSSSALVAGVPYIVLGFNADGSQSFKKTVTAS
mgnify:CR=1 FL=1